MFIVNKERLLNDNLILIIVKHIFTNKFVRKTDSDVKLIVIFLQSEIINKYLYDINLLPMCFVLEMIAVK